MKQVHLSFSSCGFLGIYHLGAATVLSKRGRGLLCNVTGFAGASAGALVATLLLTAPERIEVRGVGLLCCGMCTQCYLCMCDVCGTHMWYMKYVAWCTYNIRVTYAVQYVQFDAYSEYVTFHVMHNVKYDNMQVHHVSVLSSDYDVWHYIITCCAALLSAPHMKWSVLSAEHEIACNNMYVMTCGTLHCIHTCSEMYIITHSRLWYMFTFTEIAYSNVCYDMWLICT